MLRKQLYVPKQYKSAKEANAAANTAAIVERTIRVMGILTLVG
jgi:hypothetical protein